MKNLSNFDFNGKRALIRVDFNVPLNSDFQITDFTRIKAATPTIKKNSFWRWISSTHVTLRKTKDRL